MPVIQFYAEERRNLVKSVLLIGLFVVLMGAFGLLVDTLFQITPWATSIFLGIALLQVLVGLLSGPSLVLSSMGAQPIRPEQEAEHLELAHIVEELTIASGLPAPKLYYLPGEKGVNAFATGLRRDRAFVCVTQGLLDHLDREETQGVVAHELSHIFHRDMLYMTLLSAILGAMVIVQVLAFTGLRGVFSFSDSDNLGGCLAASLFLLVVGVLSTLFSLVGRLLVLAVSRSREYLADARSVEFTRNPYGLSRALRNIAGRERTVQAANIATAHLFISDPLDRAVNEREGFWANILSTHPPLAHRIARLEGIQPEAVQLASVSRGEEAPPLLDGLVWLVRSGSRLSNQEVGNLTASTGLPPQGEERQALQRWGEILAAYRKEPSEEGRQAAEVALKEAGLSATEAKRVLREAIAGSQDKKEIAPPSGALVVEADGSGRCRSLEDAAQQTTGDAPIFLGAGLHVMAALMRVDRLLTLMGAGLERTRLLYNGPDAAILVVEGGTFKAEGISFEHGSAAWGSVLATEGGTLSLERCSLRGGRWDPQEERGGAGLTVSGETMGRVAGCCLLANQGSGVVLGGKSQLLIEDNTLKENGLAGLAIVGSYTGTVRGNRLQHNQGPGIVAAGESRPLLERNFCLGNDRDGILVQGRATPTLVSNRCEGNHGFGLHFRQEAGGQARGNRCSGNDRGELRVEDQAKPKVENLS
ncbi:MAG: M48 family metalloprotease [Coprothermobacterota bacterium]|nr:M48 family metalloprotease [Coprothermobacterota bacterium]